MNLLKHILVMIALLAAAVPCFHAHEIELHDDNGSASAAIHASHSCGCHSCEEVPCGDTEDIPQELIDASVTVAAAPSTFEIILLPAPKPATRPAPLKVSGTLARIETVQLLI